MRRLRHRFTVHSWPLAVENTIMNVRKNELYWNFRGHSEMNALTGGATEITLHFGKEVIAIIRLREVEDRRTQVQASFSSSDIAVSFARDWFAFLKESHNIKPPKWLAAQDQPPVAQPTTPAAPGEPTPTTKPKRGRKNMSDEEQRQIAAYYQAHQATMGYNQVGAHFGVSGKTVQRYVDKFKMS